MKPFEAMSLDDAAKLEKDGFESKEFWIMTDGDAVTIAKQSLGKHAEWMQSIPVKDFAILAAWFMGCGAPPTRYKSKEVR